MKQFAIRPVVLAGLLATTTLSAWATDGYFAHGYGIKAKGMGGAAVASTDNAFAGANNPATAAWAGSRMEAGVDLFMPDRGMSRTGGMDANVTSDSKSFLVPEFGYNKVHNAQISYGVTVYGNGGMNTDYAGGQTDCGNFGGPGKNALCGSDRLGVNLMQLIIAPTLGYKLDDKHAVGISPLIIVQQFSAEGLQLFTQGLPGQPPFSSQGTKVTNNGNEKSTGIGVRLGYLGKMNDKLNVGVSYSPKISMSKLGSYAGLFAEGGALTFPKTTRLDLPINSPVKRKLRWITNASVIRVSVPSETRKQISSLVKWDWLLAPALVGLMWMCSSWACNGSKRRSCNCALDTTSPPIRSNRLM